MDFLDGVKSAIVKLINDNLKEHNAVKVNLELFSEYVKGNDDEQEESTKSFNWRFRPVFASTPI